MYKFILGLLVVSLTLSLASGEVWLDEDFSSGTFDRWVQSTHKGAEAGSYSISAGKYYGDAEKDKGLKTNDNARFYQISTKLDKPIATTHGKTLVLQYSVKQEQNIDCGGAYIKLLPSGLDQDDFNGDSPYAIMFGPDICGSSTRRVHVIFNYKGQNHLISKTIPCKTDEDNHVYTLIVKPDQTYQVLINNEEVASGNYDDWSFLPPKKIKDPSQSKPADWVDAAQIADPEDVKPADWDSIPATIPDPEADKPDDWDDELDGEWEAPQIPNPEYKGAWSPKMIPNPAYKGPWVHPEIDNPEYKPDSNIFFYENLEYLGIEVWQVKAGSIFDNFLVTDDVNLAHSRAQEVIARSQIAVAAKKAAEEEAALKAAGADDDDDDDDEHVHKEIDEDEFQE
jgi:calreticulin